MTHMYTADAPLMLARRQFDAFNEIGHGIAMTEERRRRLLSMSAQEWSAWEAFAQDGGTPPPLETLPEVLLRLANASYRLSVRTDRERHTH
ncbi:MAG TPA: hypothetical protein VFE41_05475 [Acetobacteraceae bacterium]|jgi:hypothetical protein|nr:hypothetical protein [Acetobacteraceae bacterium]HTC11257.1 hypothetical protein [Acetobacteraceae bacterium]